MIVAMEQLTKRIVQVLIGVTSNTAIEKQVYLI